MHDHEPVRESDDPVHYPVEDKAGSTFSHFWARHQLFELMTDYIRRNRIPAFVGGRQFFYYQRGNPSAVVCPDLYILEDEPNDLVIRNWKLWERAGKAPALAIDIVSDEYRMNYHTHPIARYEHLGVREYIRFDPELVDPERRPLSHYIRDGSGRLIEHPTDARGVRSKFHDLWFIPQPDDSLRIAVGPHGTLLWPTHAEALAVHTATGTEAEAAARAIAEARVAALEAELERLRRR